MSILQYFPVINREIKPEEREVISYEDRIIMGRNNIKCRRDKYTYIFLEESLFLAGFFIRPIPQLVKYYKRLEIEFELILEKNFSKVFIQVIEILDLAGRDIPHIIRGSSGSCLICYLLGITDIDPIKENISLARFMHIQRDDMPDVDIDWPHHLRKNIYEKIFNHWPNRVARISNHVMYKSKSALKESIRRNGYRKFIPKNFKLEDLIDDVKKQNKIIEEASELENTFANYSLHCGGIIIFDDIVPKKYYLKEFEMGSFHGAQIKLNKDEVEDCDLIKIDILSNRGLSQLWEITKDDDYPEYDEKVFELFANGDNLGLTYGESRGMRKIFMMMKPKSIQDIACALALIRPAASSQKSDFLTNYGVEDMNDYIIYDDDAIQYIQKLLQCNESNADLWRKVFSKNKYKEKIIFKKLLKEKNPLFDDEKIDIIISQLEQLQQYSFCKSHAISYAKLLFKLAYQKVYNPHKFWTATLNNCNSSYRKWVHFREAVNSGLKICYGKKPFTLIENKLTNGSLYQTKFINDSLNDFKEHGYWKQTEFLPGMYAHFVNEIPTKYKGRGKNKELVQISEEPVDMVYFKGLVACYRPYITNKYLKIRSRKITFITIGYDNGKYLDLVLWGQYHIGNFIEGYGIVKDNNKVPWVEVIKFKLF